MSNVVQVDFRQKQEIGRKTADREADILAMEWRALVMLEQASAALKARSASAADPDARLIAACDRMEVIQEERKRIWRQKGKGYLQRLRATTQEHDALEAEIAATPAMSAAGLHAKAQLALGEMPSGGIFSLAHSTLSDLLRRA